MKSKDLLEQLKHKIIQCLGYLLGNNPHDEQDETASSFLEIFELGDKYISEYPSEVKINTLMELSFLLLYPGVLNVPGNSKVIGYVNKAKGLLKSLNNEQSVEYYDNLIHMTDFLISTVPKLSKDYLKESIRLKRKNNRNKTYCPQSQELVVSTIINKAGGESALAQQELFIYAQEWMKYRHTIPIFSNSALYESTVLNHIINGLYEVLFYRAFHVFSASWMLNFTDNFDTFIKAPFSETVKNAKICLDYSLDLTEINIKLGFEFKSINFIQFFSQFQKIHLQHQHWSKQIDESMKRAEERSKKLAIELLSAAQVKNDYFKRNLAKKKHKLVMNFPSVQQQDIPPSKPFDSKTEKTKSPDSLDNAYAQFQQGNFQEAIKRYEKNLIKNEALNESNRLKQVEICSNLGDCFKYWAKQITQPKEDKLKCLLETKALFYYDLAAEQCSIGLNEHPDHSVSFENWKSWSDFTHMARESLIPKNYIKELNEESNLYDTKENNDLWPPISKEVLITPVVQMDNRDLSLIESLLHQKVLDIIQRHHAAGYSCYLVGGFVRDYLLNKPASDIDLVTTAHPEISKKLAGEHAELIGAKHPIVRIKFNDSSHCLDIAPLRGLPSPDRPAVPVNLDNSMLVSIVPTNSVAEDCLHRDSTINALYYNLQTKQVLDPTGQGLDDLKEKKVRLIGDPCVSVNIDPLRMYRVLRLSTSLDFTMDSMTQQALAKNKALIAHINPARLLLELHKMLFTRKGVESFAALEKYGLLDVVKSAMRSNQMDYRTMMQTILTEIKDKTLSENNAWLLFLSGLFWPRVRELYWQKKDHIDEESIREVLKPFYYTLRNTKINLKLQQIWSQATHDELRFAALSTDEYSLINRFKNFIQPSLRAKTSFFNQIRDEKSNNQERSDYLKP